FVAGLRKDLEDETFLSNCDLVTAWMSHAIIASKGPSAAMIFSVFDLRSRLAELSSTARPYVQNLVLPLTVYFPGLSSSLPTLGYTAQRIRHCITEQTTDTQARRMMRLGRESYASNGLVPFFGHQNAMIIQCTNWTKARLEEVADFSPAVIPTPSAKAGGLPVSYWGTSTLDDKAQNFFAVYGKDNGGNYWLQACLKDETWRKSLPFQVPTETNAHLANISPPPASLINQVITAVPPSALVQIMNPTKRRSLAEQIRAGTTPEWYSSLPTDVRNYMGRIRSQVQDGALTQP
ncbi:hypothetical protein LTS12_028485, partial [Elasticomyces elasticus]